MQTSMIQRTNRSVKNSKALLGILTVFILLGSGCLLTIPTRYTPQNYIRVNGNVSLGTFRYLPSEKGDLPPNEIEHDLGHPINITTDIADYVKRANALELEKSSIQVKVDSPYKLSAEIKKLFAGFIGFNVGWKYDVTHRLTRKTDLSVLIETLP